MEDVAPYIYYDSEFCAKIGKYADTSGNVAAVLQKFRVQVSIVEGPSSQSVFQPCNWLSMSGFAKYRAVCLVEAMISAFADWLSQLLNKTSSYVRKFWLADGIVIRANVIAVATEYTNPALLLLCWEGSTPILFWEEWVWWSEKLS